MVGVDEVDDLAASQLLVDRRDDRIHDVIKINERELELAIAEHEPASGDLSRDRAIDQRNLAAEDLSRPQDHARQSELCSLCDAAFGFELRARVRAALFRARFEWNGLVDDAVAGHPGPVDDGKR